MEPSGGVYTLPVRINDTITIPFVLDSGAAEVALPIDVFLTLLRTGTVGRRNFVGEGTYTLADGKQTKSDRYTIYKMQVGTHVVSNVIASVVPVHGDPLLGQSFLSKLPSWTIDNSNHVLVLDEIGSSRQPALSPAPRTDTVRFTAALEPDKQGGPGKGTANLSIDTASKTLTMSVEYSGLSAPPAMAAFLSPPPKQGANPGTLPIPLPDKATSPINVTMKLTDPAINGLKGGDWVILLGTKQAPEIGGEVKPVQ